MPVLLALTAIGQWDLLRGGTLVGMDAATAFYPWYTFLGEQLRAGRVPAWNPHQFSGAPFAGDPESGWMYLPAMVLFTVLPLGTAATAYLLVHPLLAGLSAYALARALGMSAVGALLAGTAYAHSGFLYRQNGCCFALAAVPTWLPLALLGAELAIRSSTWAGRVRWWGLAGLALSQILAAWIGQGSYYALLALGGYVAYRTLLCPAGARGGVRARLAALVVHGGGVVLLGFGLAAAGVLPRLEFFGVSNLAGGYAGEEVGFDGWSIRDWGLLLTPGAWFAGRATLVLALAAPLVARGRFAVPYFVALSLGALILASGGTTPLHAVAYLLPGFAHLHTHHPERVLMVFYLAPALLAGATLTCLTKRADSLRRPALLPVVAAPVLAAHAVAPPPTTPLALTWAAGFAAVYALVPARRPLAAALLPLVLFAELLAAGRAAIARETVVDPFDGADEVLKIDLERYYEASGAVRFLRAQSERGEPFRYFGYGPEIRGRTIAYTPRWADPETIPLQVTNRATLFGLQDIQGYNPLHVARYDEFMAALNGRPQNYHDAQVLEPGLDSPLLPLLNARYIIIPSGAIPSQPDLRRLDRAHPTVYADEQVKVLEHRGALPRAWIVHAARQVGPGEALDLLRSGAVDPRRTAVLEGPPPDLGASADASADEASVTAYEPDRIRVRTTTDAAGLLVLSEVYYPAWHAYVDGRPVPLYAANHVLRAVPIPAGEHLVELRYESPALAAGVAISPAACTGLLLLAIGSGVHRRRGSVRTRPVPARVKSQA